MAGHPKQKTIHLVANAHIDPVWLWHWQEGCAELRSTCRAAVDFLENNRELTFTRSSAGDLQWIADLEPKVFARMRRLVRRGQWENVGGWWTQPDCNIPNGESYVRQGLYGQRFFRDKLGGMAHTGYNVDSFGHNANLPQILAGCGLKHYVFMRPSSLDENPRIPQGYFQWQGIDGTRLTAFHVFEPYCIATGAALEKSIGQGRKFLEKTGESLMVFFGVGNHGGGPTREMLAMARQLRAVPGMPALKFATTAQAFAAVACEGRRLPLFTGELQHNAPGCYAAHGEIKRLNRRAEEALLAAERLSAMAQQLAGRRYPLAAITAAWKDALFCQFHDILSGSALREAYTDARDQLGRAIFTAEEALNAAQQALAGSIDTRGEGIPVVVFNPHTFEYDGTYETQDLQRGGFRSVDLRNVSLFDADGREHPTQLVPTSSQCLCYRLAFRLNVPALGYKVLWIRNRPVPSTSKTAAAPFKAGKNFLENARLRVTVGKDGIRIRDLKRRREVLKGGGAVPMVIDDPSDTWGHDVTRFDRLDGRFTLKSVRLLETGPLRGRLRAEYHFRKSRLWLDILLERDGKTIELRGKTIWLERRKILKLAVPVNVRTRVATHEIPYAAIERANTGEEEPIQQWVDVADGRAGLSLINADKYSASVAGTEIRQTLLRSMPFAWIRCKNFPLPWDNVKWREEDWYGDQGMQEFRLLLLPHDGDWRTAGTVRAARLFNRALVLQPEGAHAGTLPPENSFIRVDGKSVWVSVVKQAEEGRGLVVRAVETSGAKARAQFTIPGMNVRWAAQFRPWQIRTFRIADGRVREVDMLEQ